MQSNESGKPDTTPNAESNNVSIRNPDSSSSIDPSAASSHNADKAELSSDSNEKAKSTTSSKQTSLDNGSDEDEKVLQQSITPDAASIPADDQIDQIPVAMTTSTESLSSSSSSAPSTSGTAATSTTATTSTASDIDRKMAKEERKKEREKKKEEEMLKKYNAEQEAKQKVSAKSKCGRWIKHNLKREQVDTKEKRQQMFKETEIMLKMNHPHIVRCFDVFNDWLNVDDPNNPIEEKGVVIIQELMAVGTLKSVIKKNFLKGQCILKFPLITRWWHQILDALRYMHQKVETPILHRDLKAENCFLYGDSDEEYLNVKVGDFGLATQIRNSGRQTMLGTVGFMAPEIFDEKYDEKVDIYAFGMLMLEVMTNRTPFDDCATVMQVATKTMTGWGPTLIDNVSNPAVRQVITACIHPLACYRPTAEELYFHPLFQHKTLPVEVEPNYDAPDRTEAIDRFVRTLNNPETRNPKFTLRLRFRDKKMLQQLGMDDGESLEFDLDIYRAEDQDIPELIHNLRVGYEDKLSRVFVNPKVSDRKIVSSHSDKLFHSIRLQMQFLVKLLLGKRWKAILEAMIEEEFKQKPSPSSPSENGGEGEQDESDLRTFELMGKYTSLWIRAKKMLEKEIQSYRKPSADAPIPQKSTKDPFTPTSRVHSLPSSSPTAPSSPIQPPPASQQQPPKLVAPSSSPNQPVNNATTAVTSNKPVSSLPMPSPASSSSSPIDLKAAVAHHEPATVKTVGKFCISSTPAASVESSPPSSTGPPDAPTSDQLLIQPTTDGAAQPTTSRSGVATNIPTTDQTASSFDPLKVSHKIHLIQTGAWTPDTSELEHLINQLGLIRLGQRPLQPQPQQQTGQRPAQASSESAVAQPPPNTAQDLLSHPELVQKLFSMLSPPQPHSTAAATTTGLPTSQPNPAATAIPKSVDEPKQSTNQPPSTQPPSSQPRASAGVVDGSTGLVGESAGEVKTSRMVDESVQAVQQPFHVDPSMVGQVAPAAITRRPSHDSSVSTTSPPKQQSQQDSSGSGSSNAVVAAIDTPQTRRLLATSPVTTTDPTPAAAPVGIEDVVPLAIQPASLLTSSASLPPSVVGRVDSLVADSTPPSGDPIETTAPSGLVNVVSTVPIHLEGLLRELTARLISSSQRPCIIWPLQSSLQQHEPVCPKLYEVPSDQVFVGIPSSQLITRRADSPLTLTYSASANETSLSIKMNSDVASASSQPSHPQPRVYEIPGDTVVCLNLNGSLDQAPAIQPARREGAKPLIPASIKVSSDHQPTSSAVDAGAVSEAKLTSDLRHLINSIQQQLQRHEPIQTTPSGESIPTEQPGYALHHQPHLNPVYSSDYLNSFPCAHGFRAQRSLNQMLEQPSSSVKYSTASLYQPPSQQQLDPHVFPAGTVDRSYSTTSSSTPITTPTGGSFPADPAALAAAAQLAQQQAMTQVLQAQQQYPRPMPTSDLYAQLSTILANMAGTMNQPTASSTGVPHYQHPYPHSMPGQQQPPQTISYPLHSNSLPLTGVGESQFTNPTVATGNRPIPSGYDLSHSSLDDLHGSRPYHQQPLSMPHPPPHYYDMAQLLSRVAAVGRMPPPTVAQEGLVDPSSAFIAPQQPQPDVAANPTPAPETGRPAVLTYHQPLPTQQQQAVNAAMAAALHHQQMIDSTAPFHQNAPLPMQDRSGATQAPVPVDHAALGRQPSSTVANKFTVRSVTSHDEEPVVNADQPGGGGPTTIQPVNRGGGVPLQEAVGTQPPTHPGGRPVNVYTSAPVQLQLATGAGQMPPPQAPHQPMIPPPTTAVPPVYNNGGAHLNDPQVVVPNPHHPGANGSNC